eukprot:1376494-Amorphochlora_amoeboformis.AAC.1
MAERWRDEALDSKLKGHEDLIRYFEVIYWLNSYFILHFWVRKQNIPRNTLDFTGHEGCMQNMTAGVK